jgi:hypothetical protein
MIGVGPNSRCEHQRRDEQQGRSFGYNFHRFNPKPSSANRNVR